MLKTILISIGFAICGYIVGPTEDIIKAAITFPAPIVYSRTSIDFTVKSDDYYLMLDVSDRVYDIQRAITKKWLPEKIPRGMRHTTIHVYMRSYNRAYCTMSDHPRIYIYSDGTHLYETLRHEMTHALLMIRYPDLPRWTHEGIASSYDGPGHQKMYRKILSWSRAAGTYPKLAEIMAGVRFNSYNSTAYTTSNSLVKFLLTKGDKYTLFLYSINKATLERAYGYESTFELQRAWISWLNRPAVAKKPYSPVQATKPQNKKRLAIDAVKRIIQSW